VIETEKLRELETIHLLKGAHEERESGMCAMEAVAWLAGEPHSDRPQCACPVISAFMTSWNDALPDAERDRLLKPLLAKIVDTRASRATEERRSYLALDWLIRVATPEWLALCPDLRFHAETLRGLAAIVDTDVAEAASVEVRHAAVRALRAAEASTPASAIDLFERMLAVKD